MATRVYPYAPAGQAQEPPRQTEGGLNLRRSAVADISDARQLRPDRDDIDDVRNGTMAERGGQGAGLHEASLPSGLGHPARFRTKVDIAAKGVVICQVDRRGEVVEVELAHLPLKAELPLVSRLRGPGRQQSRFHIGEACFSARIPALRQPRRLDPRTTLDAEIGPRIPVRGRKDLTPNLLHIDRGRRQRHGDAPDLKALGAVQGVQGDLSAELPAHSVAPLAAHDGASDRLGCRAEIVEALDGVADAPRHPFVQGQAILVRR